MDTGAWIALLSPGDTYAPMADQVLATLQIQRVPLLTSSAVVFEVLDGAAERNREFSQGLRFLFANFAVEVVHVDEDLMQRARDFYEARPDKNWSLTDCTSFVLMRARSVSDAFAHDHHFEQAGFRALMRVGQS